MMEPSSPELGGDGDNTRAVNDEDEQEEEEGDQLHDEEEGRGMNTSAV